MSFITIFYFAVLYITTLEINQIICDEYKVVETSNGAVRGVKNKIWWKNVDYYSFKGIPYAEPPIGKLRFKVFHSLLISNKKAFVIYQSYTI